MLFAELFAQSGYSTIDFVRKKYSDLANKVAAQRGSKKGDYIDIHFQNESGKQRLGNVAALRNSGATSSGV